MRIAIASGLAFVSVALGAFGAHSLKGEIAPEFLAAFQTGVQYQFFHAIALFLTALLEKNTPHRIVRWASGAFLLGIALFSGSLYLMAVTGVRKWGIVTPLGGVSFLVGWGLLTYFGATGAVIARSEATKQSP